MSIPGTGRVQVANGSHELVVERTFNAPIGDVWRSIVEPERMNRWIGTWSGEAGVGKTVQFVMTAEGSSEPEDAFIHACDAPYLLDVETVQGEGSWRMRLNLSEADGVTTLVFSQVVEPTPESASYGVGWEYYMDRLVATFADAEFANWDDYYPAQIPYWEAQLASAAS